MKTYILKLNSGVDYKLYDGSILVSDADLATLFATAGEGYFTFDFNSGTPSALTNFTISDSNDTVVITQTSAAVAEGPNYKGTWSASATAFDTFDKLGGVAMDEAELSFLMGKTKKVEDAAFVGSVLSTPSSVAYVATDNIQDGAVTSDKIDYETFTLAPGDVSMGSTRSIRIGNIIIINIQTANHHIALNETYGTVPSEYRPSGPIIVPGIIQGTGASCSIALTSSTGAINLQACSNIPSTDNRVAFTLVYTI